MRPGESREKKMVFILGSPRSGTTWLHSILSDHPQVASLAPVELTHFGNYLPQLVERWEFQKKNREKGLQQGLPMIWDDTEFNAFLGEFTDRVYDKVLARNPGATHIVDKHPNYSNHVHLIRRFYPDAKFIHVIRDGRDVVISSKSAKKRSDFMHDDVAVMAKKWVRFIGNARKAEYGEGNYCEARYEDMLADCEGELARILHFLQLPAGKDDIQRLAEKNTIEKKPVSSVNESIHAIRSDKKKLYAQELTLEERYLFQLIAGKLMKELKYADNDQWIFRNTSDKLKLFIVKARYKLLKPQV